MQYGILRHGSRIFLIPNGLTMIGRHGDCTFVLDDSSVSRQHALIHARDGLYTLMDYKSSNGVRVNGEDIFRHRLSPGDEVIFGEARCTFAVETDLEGAWRDELEGFEGAYRARAFLPALERGTRFGLLKDRPRFQFLLEAAKDLAGADSPRQLGIRALHAALTGVGASRGFVALLHGERTEIINSIGIQPSRIFEVPFYLAMAHRAVHAREVLRTSESFADFMHHEPRLVLEDIGSAMAAPLPGARGAVAAVYIDRLMAEPPFPREAEEPLAVLAHGVGLALESCLWRVEIEEGLGAMEFLGTGSGEVSVVCGVCREPGPGSGREVVLCDSCNAVHHRDCWEYNRGCARYACGGAAHQSLGMMALG